jgi:hypothetical protein
MDSRISAMVVSCHRSPAIKAADPYLRRRAAVHSATPDSCAQLVPVLTCNSEDGTPSVSTRNVAFARSVADYPSLKNRDLVSDSRFEI